MKGVQPPNYRTVKCCENCGNGYFSISTYKCREYGERWGSRTSICDTYGKGREFPPEVNIRPIKQSRYFDEFWKGLRLLKDVILDRIEEESWKT
jgi:hypothetical protein